MRYARSTDCCVLYAFHSFFTASLGGWLVRKFLYFAPVLVAVGVAWQNHVAVLAMCISLVLATTEVVSLRHQRGHCLLCWM